MITLNTPGQDYGKYSQGHDRIQKAWNHFVEYLTQSKNICNKTAPSKKKNPTQLFLEFDLKQRQISNKQPRTGHKIHLGMCLAFPPRLLLTVHFIMSGSWIWENSKIMERVKKLSNPINLWDNGDWKKWPRAAFRKLPLLLKSMHNISFHLYPALHSRTKNNQSWGGTTSHLIKPTRRGPK